MAGKYNVGDRVGVVLDSDEKAVRLIGYGTYGGNEMSPLGRLSAKLVLDNGDIAWGSSCWWSSESSIKTFIGNRTVVNVPAPVIKVA